MADISVSKPLLTPTRGHMAMAGFSLLVSLSFSLGHLVANDMAPAALTTIRFILAAILMGAILWRMGVGFRYLIVAPWRWMLTGGLMAIYFITMFEALKITAPVSTAAVFTFTPLIAAGFGLVLAGQRSGTWSLTAMGIGAAGALWVIFRADWAALIRFELGRGELVFLVGAIAHAAVPAILRRINRGENALQTSLATILGALIGAAIYGWGDLRSTDYAALSPLVWGVIVYLAIFATAASFFLLQFAAQCLPAGKVMAYTYLVPSWVVLWDVLMHGRLPPLMILAGVGLTLVSLAMLLRDE